MMADSTDNRKKAILEALEEAKGIVSTACRAVGIHRSTYYDWMNNDPEFKAAADDIQEVAIDYVEGKLFEKIEGIQIGKYNEKGELQVYDVPPSDTAIIFYLKTKAKKRGYVERSEFTGADGGPLTWNEQKTYETKPETNSGT